MSSNLDTFKRNVLRLSRSDIKGSIQSQRRVCRLAISICCEVFIRNVCNLAAGESQVSRRIIVRINATICSISHICYHLEVGSPQIWDETEIKFPFCMSRRKAAASTLNALSRRIERGARSLEFLGPVLRERPNPESREVTYRKTAVWNSSEFADAFW